MRPNASPAVVATPPKSTMVAAFASAALKISDDVRLKSLDARLSLGAETLFFNERGANEEVFITF